MISRFSKQHDGQPKNFMLDGCKYTRKKNESPKSFFKNLEIMEV
jgi:hypothetical protein